MTEDKKKETEIAAAQKRKIAERYWLKSVVLPHCRQLVVPSIDADDAETNAFWDSVAEAQRGLVVKLDDFPDWRGVMSVGLCSSNVLGTPEITITPYVLASTVWLPYTALSHIDIHQTAVVLTVDADDREADIESRFRSFVTAEESWIRLRDAEPSSCQIIGPCLRAIFWPIDRATSEFCGDYDAPSAFVGAPFSSSVPSAPVTVALCDKSAPHGQWRRVDGGTFSCAAGYVRDRMRSYIREVMCWERTKKGAEQADNGGAVTGAFDVMAKNGAGDIATWRMLLTPGDCKLVAAFTPQRIEAKDGYPFIIPWTNDPRGFVDFNKVLGDQYTELVTIEVFARTGPNCPMGVWRLVFDHKNSKTPALVIALFQETDASDVPRWFKDDGAARFLACNAHHHDA